MPRRQVRYLWTVKLAAIPSHRLISPLSRKACNSLRRRHVSQRLINHARAFALTTAGPLRGLVGLPPLPHCPACCVALKSHWLVARCVCCVPAFSLRSSCTPIHLPTRTTGGGHDGPKSPVTLRVHAPRFRLRRRPCSHLRRTPCDQDDQPADKAGASHAGAHDCHCALPFRVRA